MAEVNITAKYGIDASELIKGAKEANKAQESMAKASEEAASKIEKAEERKAEASAKSAETSKNAFKSHRTQVASDSKAVVDAINSMSSKTAQSLSKLNSSLSASADATRAWGNHVSKNITQQADKVVSSVNKMSASLGKSFGSGLEAQSVRLESAIGKVTAAVERQTQILSKGTQTSAVDLNKLIQEYDKLVRLSGSDLGGGIARLRLRVRGETAEIIKDYERVAQAKARAAGAGSNSSFTVGSKGSGGSSTKNNSSGSSGGAFKVMPVANMNTYTSSVAGISSGMKNATLEADNFYTSLSKSWQVFSQLSFKAFILAQGIEQLAKAVAGLVSPGWEFNMQMETEQVGMAGILSSMTKLKDRNLEWNEALEISRGIMNELNIEAARTSATSSELIGTFRALLGPGLGAGMNIDQIKQFTVVGVNAVKSMGLEGRQLVQELRDLVQGGIQAASSTLATALGLTDKDIKAAKASSEGLFAFLMKRMEGFKNSAEATGGTLKGMIDQVFEGYTLAQAQGLAPLITEAKKVISSLRTVIFDNEFKIKPEVIRAWSDFSDYALKLWENLKKIWSVFQPLVEFLGGTFLEALKFVAENLTTIVGIWASANLVTSIEKVATSILLAKTRTDEFNASTLKTRQSLYAQSNIYKALAGDIELYNSTMQKALTLGQQKLESHNNYNAQHALSKQTGSIVSGLLQSTDTKDLGTQIAGIAKQYRDLGVSAQDAARMQNEAAQLAQRGYKAEAKALMETTLEMLKHGQTTLKEIKHAESFMQSYEKVRNSLSLAGSALTSVGILLGTLSESEDDAASKASKFTLELGFMVSGIASLADAIIQLLPLLSKCSWGIAAVKLSAVTAGLSLMAFGAYELAEENAKVHKANMQKLQDRKQEEAQKKFGNIGLNYTGRQQGSVETDYMNIAQSYAGYGNQKDANVEGMSQLAIDNAVDKANKDALILKYPKAPTEKKNKGASKAAKAEYKLLEEAMKAGAQRLKQTKDYLDTVYNNDLTSSQEYVEATLQAENNNFDEQIRVLQGKIEVAKKYGQTTDAERFKKELDTVAEKRNTARADAVKKLAEAYKKLDERFEKVKSSLQDLTGVSEEAFNENLIKTYAADYTRFAKESAEATNRLAIATASGDKKDISAWTTRAQKAKEAVANLKQLIAIKKLVEDASRAQAEIDKIDLDITKDTQDLQIAVNNGSLNTLDLETAQWKKKQDSIEAITDSYTTQIAIYQKLADMAKGNDTAKYVEYMNKVVSKSNELKTVLTELSPIAKEIKTDIGDELKDAFQDMFWGEKDAEEALTDFVTNFTKKITEKMFDASIDSLMGGLFGNENQIGMQVTQQVEAKVSNIDISGIVQPLDSAMKEFQERLVNGLTPAVKDVTEAMTALSNEIVRLAKQASLSDEQANTLGSSVTGKPKEGKETTDALNYVYGNQEEQQNGASKLQENTTTSEGSGAVGNVTIVADTASISSTSGLGSALSTDYSGVGGIGDSIGTFGGIGAFGGEGSIYETLTTNIGLVSTSLQNLQNGLSVFSSNIKYASNAISSNTTAETKNTQNTNTNTTNQTLATASMVTSLINATGVLGKFGTVLQYVMMIMQISKSAGILGLAEGGYISGAGTSTSDSIPTMLSNGEYVIKASSVKALGTSFLDQLNAVGGGRSVRGTGRLPRFRYADGGLVEGAEGQENNVSTLQQQGGAQGTAQPSVVMNMTFQSLDPQANMKMMEQQYPSIRSKLIRDLQGNASVRSAVKGVVK